MLPFLAASVEAEPVDIEAARNHRSRGPAFDGQRTPRRAAVERDYRMGECELGAAELGLAVDPYRPGTSARRDLCPGQKIPQRWEPQGKRARGLDGSASDDVAAEAEIPPRRGDIERHGTVAAVAQGVQRLDGERQANVLTIIDRCPCCTERTGSAGQSHGEGDPRRAAPLTAALVEIACRAIDDRQVPGGEGLVAVKARHRGGRRSCRAGKDPITSSIFVDLETNCRVRQGELIDLDLAAQQRERLERNLGGRDRQELGREAAGRAGQRDILGGEREPRQQRYADRAGEAQLAAGFLHHNRR